MKIMRLISYNVNGIRAAMKKGFCDWLQTNPADIVCIQETKAQQGDVDQKLLAGMGYQDYWNSAEKKGYSGVAVFTRIKPDFVQVGNGYMQSDAEGRVLRLDFGDITLLNAYFPSGTTGDVRQAYKYIWLNELLEYLKTLRRDRSKIILCGDYNIAHRAIDIHDPKGNKNSSGFLPEERAWMDQFFAEGFTDSFRHINQEPHHYSWWTARFPSARLNNKGWRIDYINVTDNLKADIKDARMMPDVKHSDHCPVYLELGLGDE
jgi:exodeoxyribonuclease-3